MPERTITFPDWQVEAVRRALALAYSMAISGEAPSDTAAAEIEAAHSYLKTAQRDGRGDD